MIRKVVIVLGFALTGVLMAVAGILTQYGVHLHGLAPEVISCPSPAWPV